MYSAVAFMGTYTISIGGTPADVNMFAVGDLNGNVYIMYPTFSSSGDPQTMVLANTNAYTYNCGWKNEPCGRVTALAKDPSSDTLYISFANISENNTNEWNYPQTYYEKALVQYKAAPATLVVAGINSNGSLATTPTNTYQNYAWQDFGANGINGTGAFDYVSPKLRVYPSNYPGLSGTDYFTTGAVFYSGIIEGQSNSYFPVNKGYLCSGNQCEVSFAIALEDGKGFSVMTSAEYGVDVRGASTVPVLYWNQVGATIVVPPFNSDGSGYYSAIVKGTSNTVQSCQLIALINPTITNSACRAYVPLAWPPASAPFVGPFVNEMVYLQTPQDPTASPPAPYASPSSFGVLMMSVWSPGFLVYHALDGNEGTSLLFEGNGSDGEIGANPVSLLPDQSGSVFMEAGAEGLVGFNIFAEYQNLGTSLDQFTYIDITSGGSGGGKSGVGSIVLNAIDIIGSVASTAGLIVTLQASTLSRLSIPTSTWVSSLPLKGALGSQPHRGRYTYDETAMKKMGIKRGQWITGLRLAVAQGISSRPKQDVKVQQFQVQIESGGKVGSRPTSSYPATVYDRSLCIARESYDRTKDPEARRPVHYGFGPLISFDRPYRYLGGDLTMSIFGSGYSYTEFPFYIEATSGSGVSGAYVTGTKALEMLPSEFPEVRAAPNVIFQTGPRSYGRRSLLCN